jgi:predicted transcriptional regulator
MAASVLSDPIALRIPEDILTDIDTIAGATERSRNWVIVRALKYYLMQEGNDVLQILKGEEAIRRGDVMDMDDFLAELEAEDELDATASGEHQER